MQRHGLRYLVGALTFVVVLSSSSPCFGDRLSRSALSAGGTFQAASESYRLSSAIGQATIGTCASEGYILSFGFWGAPGVPTGVSADQAETPRAFRLLGINPNPSNSEAVIVFDLPRPTPVEVRVFDISGRLTRAVADGRLEIGRHSIAWDGRSDAGTPVAAGVYMILVHAGTDHALSKFVLLR
jgi:hypothetical protein